MPALSPRKTRSQSRAARRADDAQAPRHSKRESATTTHRLLSVILVGPHGVDERERPRPRLKIAAVQRQRLEELYEATTHPSTDAKESLAREIGM